jgi:hypothetical protein
LALFQSLSLFDVVFIFHVEDVVEGLDFDGCSGLGEVEAFG